MSNDNPTLREGSLDRSVHVLGKTQNSLSKISAFLLSNSTPMSGSDKVGLSLTIIALGVVLGPIALSDSDPYHIKWLFDEVKGNVPLIDSISEDNNPHYRVIAHLKISHDNHIDATEKIILGKYRSFTN